MKYLLGLILLTALPAAAKSPFQLSGRLESATFSGDEVTFVISGELSIQEFRADGSIATLKLPQSRVVAKKFSVLAGANGPWARDKRAFEALLAASRDNGHKVRGGASGVVVRFSNLGVVEQVTIDDLSLIDSTVLDPAQPSG